MGAQNFDLQYIPCFSDLAYHLSSFEGVGLVSLVFWLWGTIFCRRDCLVFASSFSCYSPAVEIPHKIRWMPTMTKKQTATQIPYFFHHLTDATVWIISQKQLLETHLNRIYHPSRSNWISQWTSKPLFKRLGAPFNTSCASTVLFLRFRIAHTHKAKKDIYVRRSASERDEKAREMYGQTLT